MIRISFAVIGLIYALAQSYVYGKGKLQDLSSPAGKPVMNVSDAVAYRRSVRGFLDTPVDLALVRDIIERAARAATGGNVQPWHVDLVHGDSMDRLKAIMAEKIAARQPETPEYNIYPPSLKAPYEDRRFEVGEMLYGALAIPREDKRARAIWFSRNFQFFGAPVGLFLSLDRQMGPPQWGDAGMLLQNIMLLLCEAGMDSCPQECWAIYPKTIGAFLGLPEDRILWTGMAIGYKDAAEPANALMPTRAPAGEWLVEHR
jgi:nitroreductase